MVNSDTYSVARSGDILSCKPVEYDVLDEYEFDTPEKSESIDTSL